MLFLLLVAGELDGIWKSGENGMGLWQRHFVGFADL